ncbi:MAG: NTP transferase domain-containing protein [Planctomycetes bacterium]|nr:NTP transferase domain-containing protein [Planctomycetota bacterium]
MKSERAKVLHEILGAPLVAHVLKAVRDAGVADVLVVVGCQAGEVRAVAGPEAAFVEQEEQKGTGHALLCCGKVLAGFAGDLLVLAGDAPLVRPETLRAMLESHRRAGADATILSAVVESPAGYGRVVRDAEGRFLRIVEDADAAPQERSIREINSGAYVFRTPRVLGALREVRPENAQREYYLPDVLKAMKTIEVVRTDDPAEALGVNTRRELAATAAALRRRILDRHMDAGVSIVDPGTTYIEDGVEIAPDAVIHPFTVIRRGVRIGPGCHVGPFSHLRGETVLEERAEIGNFVEVKKSRVGARSKAKHLAYLGDATLGADVNIGAGTITANYDGAKKHPTVIEDGASTGSNTVLVAPVRLGKGAKTGAGAVVPRGEVKAGTLVVGVPARPLARKSAPARAGRGKT